MFEEEVIGYLEQTTLSAFNGAILSLGLTLEPFIHKKVHLSLCLTIQVTGDHKWNYSYLQESDQKVMDRTWEK